LGDEERVAIGKCQWTCLRLITMFIARRTNVRTLLVITGIVAGLVVVTFGVGYEEGLGVLLAVVLLAWALRCRRRGMYLSLRYLAAVFSLATIWMVAVDRSAIFETCDDCKLGRFICQWRLFRIPLCESVIRENNTIISRIAADLGEPCAHRFDRMYLSRYWGVFFPAHPNFCGIVSLSGDDNWCDENVAEIVRAKGRASPEMAKEFHQKTIVGHDYAYLRQLCAGLIRPKEESIAQPESKVAPDQKR
jgi:hypothetical protein